MLGAATGKGGGVFHESIYDVMSSDEQIYVYQNNITMARCKGHLWNTVADLYTEKRLLYVKVTSKDNSPDCVP